MVARKYVSRRRFLACHEKPRDTTCMPREDPRVSCVLALVE